MSENAKKNEIPAKTPYLVNNYGYIINSDLPGTASTSTSTLGLVKVDGNIMIIDNNGVISGAKEVTISTDEGNTLVNELDGLYAPTVDLFNYVTINSLPTKSSYLINDGEDGTSFYIEIKNLSKVVSTKLSELTNDLLANILKAGKLFLIKILLQLMIKALLQQKLEVMLYHVKTLIKLN